MEANDLILDTCLAALRTALANLQPELAGLQDQRVLPNAAATNTALDTQIALFAHRQALLAAALAALDALQADGYPTLPAQDVSAEVYRELQQHAAEVGAALEHFRHMARLNVPHDAEVEVQYPEGAMLPASESAL